MLSKPNLVIVGVAVAAFAAVMYFDRPDDYDKEVAARVQLTPEQIKQRQADFVNEMKMKQKQASGPNNDTQNEASNAQPEAQGEPSESSDRSE